MSFEGKGKDATSRTMSFTKKTTVKPNIKMAECKNTDNRVWFIEQSLQIKHKDHREELVDGQTVLKCLGLNFAVLSKMEALFLSPL